MRVKNLQKAVAPTQRAPRRSCKTVSGATWHLEDPSRFDAMKPGMISACMVAVLCVLGPSVTCECSIRWFRERGWLSEQLWNKENEDPNANKQQELGCCQALLPSGSGRAKCQPCAGQSKGN